MVYLLPSYSESDMDETSNRKKLEPRCAKRGLDELYLVRVLLGAPL